MRNGEWPIAGPSREKSKLPDTLLKIRAAVVLLSAPWGSKKKTAEDLGREFSWLGVRFSIRSLHHWQQRYHCFGPDGLSRQHRSDRGFPRRREAIVA